MLFAQHDIINVLGFVSRFYTTLGARDVEVDVDALERVLDSMREHLDAHGGAEAVSPFKKAASFVCHFVEQSPLKTRLPRASTLARAIRAATGSQPNQNAVLALRIAMESLQGATLRRSDGQELVLSCRLDLSRHSYVDIVEALSDATPAHFRYVAVLLEQMAYKTNPRCQYATYRVPDLDSPKRNLEALVDDDDLKDVWAGRARLEVQRRAVPSLAPEEVTKGLDRSRIADEIRNAPFHYRQSRTDPALVDRVAADGAVATGRVRDGVFVEESADESS
ncbi:MAG: hypothetical protein OXM56_06950 [Gammaproteobacteria bacterium]|nr:hypothetical protein [Gammaproteobacteria bacterium]